MDQRISFLTLAVRDLDTSRRFYVDGLGWSPDLEVDAILATARTAGADPVTEAVQREWSGYTGYFGDPDGYRWEIATNPGPIGQKVLP
jgi:catechol 2,3-dioxygenase-like lactoylglutathione lyase family enzyme